MNTHDIQTIEAHLGLRRLQGRVMGLKKLESIESALAEIDRQLESPAIPFDMKMFRNRVADARRVVREAFRAEKVLMKFPVGALTYVQRRAGLRETAWPTPRQVTWFLDSRSLPRTKHNCGALTVKGVPCRRQRLLGAGACAVHADEMDRLDSKIHWHERAAAIRQSAFEIARHPADRPLGPVVQEGTGMECEYFSWAEEMILAFDLDATDNALYDAYVELRPSAVSGDIPLWAFRTAVQRLAGKCNFET